MKAMIFAAALAVSGAAYAQSDTQSNAMPNNAESTMPVPSGAGQPMATPGESDTSTPVKNLPATAQDNGGYAPGGVGAQTADAGPMPKCSRTVTDHCVERR